MTPRQIHAARRGVLEDPDNPPPLPEDLFDLFGRAPKVPIDDGADEEQELAAADEPPCDLDEMTNLAVRLAQVARAVGWEPAGLHEEMGLAGSAEPTLVGVALTAFEHGIGPREIYRHITRHMEG